MKREVVSFLLNEVQRCCLKESKSCWNFIGNAVCFFCLLLVPALECHSQSGNDRISANYDQQPLTEVIQLLEEQLHVKFFYKKEWLASKTVTTSFSNESLTDVLTQLFEPNQLAFIFREPNFIILLPDEGTSTRQIDNTVDERLSIGGIDLEIEKAVLTGVVRDGNTNQPLESVIVSIKNHSLRYVTLSNGVFEFDLPIGNYDIQFHHPSMTDFSTSITLNSNGSLVVNMFENVTVLDEVVINTQALDQNVSKTITGLEVIDVSIIKTIPAFFGEADVFNSVLSLPGVNKVGEGSSGINVRGGGVGQNLILLDNATIYNPSHLFGFFSTFNSDVVSKVDFYKGTVPVEFGGRLSAVMDVDTKEGSKEKFKGQGGVGLVNSRVTLEGPISKESTSFLISLRGAYPNHLLKNVEDPEISESSAYFGDVNVKLDHLINDRNRISASGYWSRDLFDFSNDLEYNYGNTSGSVEWNYQISNSTSLQSHVTFTTYDYDFVEVAEARSASKLKSAIHQFTTSNRFLKESGNQELTFGFDLETLSINPGDYSRASDESEIEPFSIPSEAGVIGAIYFGDNYTINDQLSIYGGIRYSFFNGGRSMLNKFYHGPEPRISANYRLAANSSIKLGYNRMRQYVHFISNTTAATPIDLWKLSNSMIRPQVADQVTLGYFQNFEENRYEASVEAYFKKTKDLIAYKNGAELFLNDELESELIQGEGNSYGLEFLLKKKEGKIYGWVSYTFSRSLIRTLATDPSLIVNDGEFFPTNFDQPHNLSLFSSIKLSRRFSVNANFTYNTGRPISYPESIFQIKGLQVVDFVERNRYRIPDYHRLDISFVLGTTLRKEKKIEANWSLSIYNLYGRKNAYSVYYRKDGLTNTPRAYKLSVIARPILAISYNFKF